MNIPPDIFHTSKEYLMLISFTFFAEAINLCASAILRAHGCTRDPMYVNIAGNIIIILATTFSYLVTLVLLLLVFTVWQ